VENGKALEKQGANTPVEALRKTLPSFLGRVGNENDSNGGDGRAFINLRTIGFKAVAHRNRTLTIVGRPR
jgi:hypothetical protein